MKLLIGVIVGVAISRSAPSILKKNVTPAMQDRIIKKLSDINNRINYYITDKLFEENN